MNSSFSEGHDSPRARTDAASAVAVVVGGVLMAALFIPFTLAHGPTSFNEERVVLGLDMHGWGLLLGTLPNLLIAWGLWRLREAITEGRRATTVVLAITCVAMLLDAVANLAFGGLGAPFVLFVLAPTTLALAALTPARGGAGGRRLRVLLVAVGLILAVSLALALTPNETSDSFGGYRIFGTTVYGIAGILWSFIGTALRGAPPSPLGREK